MIYLYPRAMGWLIRDLRRHEADMYAVLWEMVPYGGSLSAANDD